MKRSTRLLLCALACASCTPAEKPKTARVVKRKPVEAETTSFSATAVNTHILSAADSAQVVQLRGDFKGIVFYFLSLPTSPKCRISCFGVRVQQLKLMVERENRPVPPFMAAYETWPYSIDTLDAESGFMKLTCTQCENVETLAVWSKSDGSKLIGTVDRGCGPVCSDDVKFYVAKADTIVQVPTDSVMPAINGGAFFVDPAKYTNGGPNADPEEIEHVLPRRGTTILVSLPGVDSADDRMKGNQLELVWNDGTFKIGKVYFK